MICPSCKKNNQDDAFYCPYCGFRFSDSGTMELVNQTDDGAPLTRSRLKKKKNHVPSISKIKEFSLSYLEFFIQAVKSPTTFSRKIGSEHFLNGCFTISLCALFYATGVTFFTRKISKMSHYFEEESFSFALIFIPSFLLMAVWGFGATTILYFLLKKGLKLSVSFNELVGRYGAISVIFLCFLIVGSIIPAFTIGNLFTFYINLLNILQFFIIFSTILSYRLEGKRNIDPIYIATLISGILLFIYILFMEEISRYMYFSLI